METTISQEEAVRQLAQHVASQLAAGRSGSDIEKSLTAAGVSPDVAREMVAAVAASYRKAKASPTALGWVYLILGFLVLNGILYGVQEIAATDDKRAVTQMEYEMSNLEREITELEVKANAFPGVTAVEAARYDQLIDQFNALVPTYNERAKKAYSRWWLLPIPMPRSAARAARHSGS